MFSRRLGEPPAEAHLAYYRVPKFREKMTFLWEPLLALNRAQAIVLSEVGIIDRGEAADVLAVLDDLEAVDPERFDSYEEFGGPYLFLESRVIDELGRETGGKLHTGRSRNDLFSATLRVAVRERILDLVGAALTLRERLLARAEETTDVVFPAYTHSQPAQPITFAHYLLGFDHLVARDVGRLRRAFAETNRSPLGAAAIGGTGFPLDRERLAELSGFDDTVVNTYDAIASVDYLPETTAALALLMTNVSRMSQDLLVWSMFEVGFVDLSENMSTTSSIMPQKKNPGVIEKTRAQASESIGQANSTLVSLKAVPYGDVGETTYLAYPFLGAASSAADTVRLFAAVVDDLRFDEERMYRVAQESFCTMTELADTLVREAGLSFREAHEVVGTLVRAVHEDGRHAGQITPDDLETAASVTVGETGLLSEAALSAALDPRTNVTRRDIPGGTAPEQNLADIERQRALLDEQETWFRETRDRLEAAAVARESVER